MADIWTLVKSDPEFKKMSFDDQLRVVKDNDKEFGKMSTADQIAVLAEQTGAGTIRARTWKDTASEVAHDVLPGAGLVAGGMVMGAENPLLAPVGAGLGYAEGQQIADYLDRNVLGTRPKEMPPTSDRVGTVVRDVSTGATGWMGGESVGAVAAKGLKGALAPYADALTAERMAAVRSMEGLGIKATPAETTGSRLWAGLEYLGRRVPGTAGYMQRKDTERLITLVGKRNQLLELGDTSGQSNAIGEEIKQVVGSLVAQKQGLTDAAKNKLRDRILSKYASGTSVTDAALALKEIGVQRSDAFRLAKDAAFRNVGEAIPQGVEIQTPSLQAEAKSILREQMSLDPPMRDKELLPVLRALAGEAEKEGNPILFDHKGNPAVYENQAMRTWETLSDTRAYFNSRITRHNQALNTSAPKMSGQTDPTGRAFSRLKSALNEDMQSFAEMSGPEAWDAYQVALLMHGEYKKTYGPKADFLNHIVRSNDPASLNGVTRTVFANEQTIGLANKTFGKPAVDELRRAYTRQIVDSSVDATTGVFDGKKFVQRVASISPETLNAMYGAEGTKEILAIGKQAYNLDRLPKDFLESLLKKEDGNIIPFLLNAKNPQRIAQVLPKLPKELGDKIKGQYLLGILGGEGNTATPTAMGYLATDIRVGKIPNQIAKLDSVGKVLFSDKDYRIIKEFGNALRLLGETSQMGYNPGSGVPILQGGDILGAVLNPFSKAVEWGGRHVAARLYYSDAINKLVTRRLISESQARAYGSAIGKYLGATITPMTRDNQTTQ